MLLLLWWLPPALGLGGGSPCMPGGPVMCRECQRQMGKAQGSSLHSFFGFSRFAGVDWIQITVLLSPKLCFVKFLFLSLIFLSKMSLDNLLAPVGRVHSYVTYRKHKSPPYMTARIPHLLADVLQGGEEATGSRSPLRVSN